MIMLVINFGSWGVHGTPKYYYTRLGWPFSRSGYLFGRIPWPICKREIAHWYLNAPDDLPATAGMVRRDVGFKPGLKS